MKRTAILLALTMAATAAAGTAYLRQSTAVTLKYGPKVSVADGYTPTTALTTHAAHVLLSKNGGALTAKNSTTAQVHDASGYYSVHLDTVDTGTLGLLAVVWPDPNALDVPQEYMVITANAYDSLFSTAVRPVNVTQWSGTNVATPDTAGYPKVTVKFGTGAGELNVTTGVVKGDISLVQGSSNGLSNWVKWFYTDFGNWYDDANDLVNGRLYTVSDGAGLSPITDVQTQAELAIEAKKDAIGDKVWANEPNSVRLVAVKGITDKIDTALVLDGAVYKFTTNALEEAPAPTAATDWTAAEAQQIRSALGLDGTKTAATGGQLQEVKTSTDKLGTAMEADASIWRFKAAALAEAPSSSGTGMTPFARAVAQGGSLYTITLAATASAVDSIYRGQRIVLYGGTGAGQSNLITAYNGTTKVATVLLPWVTNPNATTQYELQPGDGELLSLLRGAWQ